MTDSKPNTLVSEEEIHKRVDEISRQINSDFEGKGTLVLVGVLKGAFIFLADLSRKLTIPHSIEFIAVSSYGTQGADSGAVRLLMDVREDLVGRHVLVVEDILDTGHTLDYLTTLLKARNPASLSTCVLVRKTDRVQVNVHIDYLGFDIPDVWVVGYGLDFAEKHRTLPYIGVVKSDSD
ncbi:MAG: hypoxanthine phosphoribosyltransferase [Arenicellales bacterium]|nr:hypoxanthine phosphoribosyltransferase [Arenicellales bacterium]